MIYVCPHYHNAPDELYQHHTLYPFPKSPHTPLTDRFIILDSGAFGLSQRGEAMDERHMRRLAGYYRKYTASGNFPTLGIAPDEYLNPSQTMHNWSWWRKNIRQPVVPVIQFTKKKRLDLYTAQRQARFYAPFSPPVVAISNPGLTASESAAQNIQIICNTVRSLTGAIWLHNLGAGWSPQDIAHWRDLACFDSIDSIAYYTDAQDGWRWRPDASRERTDADWRTTALHNADAVAAIAHAQPLT